jgi:general stress protein YciG
MASNNQGNKQSGGTKNRGFASMDPERQREIASQGGKAAHQKGTAHEFTSEEARRAGSMAAPSFAPANDRGARAPRFVFLSHNSRMGCGRIAAPFCPIS